MVYRAEVRQRLKGTVRHMNRRRGVVEKGQETEKRREAEKYKDRRQRGRETGDRWSGKLLYNRIITRYRQNEMEGTSGRAIRMR
jgi:hypothetical protein